MLQTFRRAKSSWFVLGLLGLVMIAFVFTGVDMRGTGPTADAEWLARVDGTPLTVNDVTEEMNRQLARVRQEQQRPDLDMATFVRGGAFESILDQMIADRAIVAFGEEQGLKVPDQMVNREIASAPAFQNLAGKFEDAQMRQWLAQEKKTEKGLRDEIAAQML